MSWHIFWVSQDKVETMLTKEQTNMGMPLKKFHPSLGVGSAALFPSKAQTDSKTLTILKRIWHN